VSFGLWWENWVPVGVSMAILSEGREDAMALHLPGLPAGPVPVHAAGRDQLACGTPLASNRPSNSTELR
jgi:hypothetical protein